MKPVSLFALSEAMADSYDSLGKEALDHPPMASEAMADSYDSLGTEALDHPPMASSSAKEEALDHPPMASSSAEEEVPVPLPIKEPESSGSLGSKRWRHLAQVTPPESSGSACRPLTPRYKIRTFKIQKKPKRKKATQKKPKQKEAKQKKAKQKKEENDEDDEEMPKRKRIRRLNGECFMFGCTNPAPAALRSKWCKQHGIAYRALYRSASRQGMLKSFNYSMQCPKSAAVAINHFEKYGLWL